MWGLVQNCQAKWDCFGLVIIVIRKIQMAYCYFRMPVQYNVDKTVSPILFYGHRNKCLRLFSCVVMFSWIWKCQSFILVDCHVTEKYNQFRGPFQNDVIAVTNRDIEPLQITHTGLDFSLWLVLDVWNEISDRDTGWVQTTGHQLSCNSSLLFSVVFWSIPFCPRSVYS